ncbi:hypothetical protein U1Q18_005069, partial [Sarracenia purpurea var. burkii]
SKHQRTSASGHVAGEPPSAEHGHPSPDQGVVVEVEVVGRELDNRLANQSVEEEEREKKAIEKLSSIVIEPASIFVERSSWLESL